MVGDVGQVANSVVLEIGVDVAGAGDVDNLRDATKGVVNGFVGLALGIDD